MRKRLICLLLTVVMLLGITPVVSLPVRAASNLTTSKELVELLVAFEGFIPACRLDGDQRSVGYGTRCDVCDDKAPGYPWSITECSKYTVANPITKEHALELKMRFLRSFETALNGFADDHGLTFTQQQFDALISFTYNLGIGWMYENGKDGKELGNMYTAVSSGDTGAFLAYAMGLYKTANEKVSVGHINRRMLELQVYFYGIYGVNQVYNYQNWPEKVRYVCLDGNGGQVKYGIQAFDIDHPTGILEKVTPPTGYEFAGWYTQREGGIQIKELNESIPRGMELYAHWKNAAGEIVTLPGDSLTYTDMDVDVVVNHWDVPIYAGPGDYYYEVRRMTGAEQVHITKVTTGKDGNLLGLCADGWVKLSQTNYSTVVSDTTPDTEGDNWYKVTALSGLNVRTGPGTGNPKLEELFKPSGTRIQIVATQAEANTTRVWGQMVDGNWICIEEDGESYVTTDPAQGESSDGSSQTPLTGNTVTGLTLISPPIKTQYDLNGKWIFPDLTGGQIEIHYGPTPYRDKLVDITHSMVSGFDNSTLGPQTITVTCSGYTVTFTVEIVPAKVTAISVHTKPIKTEYLFKNEKLDLTGAVLVVTYEKGLTRQIPITAEMVTGFDNATLGTNTLTVTYSGFTATFDVTIINPVVTFLNYDGTVISQKQYVIGETVTAPENPVRPADEKGEYVFAGWDKKVVACAGNATYTATYTLKPRITFLNYDGTVISQKQYLVGESVTIPADPVKPADKMGEYVFAGWDKPVVACAGDATYTATFKLRYAIGDLDRNDKVDENDAIYLMWHVFFPEENPIYAWADFDKNNVVDEKDGSYLLWYVFFPEEYPLS